MMRYQHAGTSGRTDNRQGLATHPGLDPTRDLIVERIPVTDLRFDTRYQRVVDSAHVSRIARRFDVRKMGLVVVSLREDGGLYVVDGQHRVEAVRLVDPAFHVSCVIYGDLTPGEEAELFADLQKDRKGMSPEDLFWAEFIAGNAEAVGVAQAVERGGFTLRRKSRGATGINCFSALRTAYRYDKGESLGRALQVIGEAWGREEPPRATAIRALSRFVLQYRDGYSRDRLFAVIEGTTQNRVEAGSKEMAGVTGGGAWVSGARFVLHLYNRGLRANRLPEWTDFS